MKLPNKNFFSNNFIIDIFLLIAAIFSLFVTTLAIYLLCKHRKLRMLVTSLALQQIRQVGAVIWQEDIPTACNCIIQFYTILELSASIFSSVIFAVLPSRKLKLCNRMFVLKCGKNDAIYFRCTILCTNKIMWNCRKHSLIQNDRYAKTGKCKAKMTLYLGHNRNRLEGVWCNF